MTVDITAICLPLPYGLGSVNCYLIAAGAGYILVDTGCANGRKNLIKSLESAGCMPGNLSLILITHGDFDHTGNAAHLCTMFATKLAMHADDAAMLERGDMFWNRKKGNIFLRKIAPALFKFNRSDRMRPEIVFHDGDNLAEFGLDALVISIPGHSKGSIGLLLANGDLFCGDLFDNTHTPVLNTIMDDLVAAKSSVDKLKRLDIKRVYPGHGKPFMADALWKNCS